MSIIASFAVPHPPIIFPEIGRGEEKRIQKTINAYREVARRIAEIRPDTIVLSSPHAMIYADYLHISPGDSADGDMHSFGAQKLSTRVAYDVEFVSELSRLAEMEYLPGGTDGGHTTRLDHGTVVPLLFINEEFKDYRLVRTGLSGLSPTEHYRFGQLISRTADALDRRVVFIASGDLSHKLIHNGPYGFSPEGPEFDKRVTRALAEGDFLKLLDFEPDFCTRAAECGLRSLQIMAGVLDGKKVVSELLSYEGPFGVGYAVAAFTVTGEDVTRQFEDQFDTLEKARLEMAKNKQDDYVRLARISLETYVKTGKFAALPNDLPLDMLDNKAGVFVSLKDGERLRGCIGTISPVESNIAREILRNAVSAGAEDPRFLPVRKDELSRLTYSVDVLGKAQAVDSLEELDVKRYGVIVTSGRRRGLLLPNLEGVDSVEEQVAIAKQKAGIGERESVSLERFEVIRHK